jgi:orotate phosphoribosyltransferase
VNLQDFLTHLSGQPGWAEAGQVTPLSRAGSGDTPLHAAIWVGDDEAARHLIDAGADVNAAGEDGYTPIHAALAQSNVALARRLTACGASWDAVNAFACSVRDAARRSDDPAVRALLEQEELVSQLPGRIGHFRLESGHHSDLWIDLELLCLRPEFVQQRAAELAARLAPLHVDAVCGPLVEGAYVALLVAARLGVEFYYTERFVPEDDGLGATLFPVDYRLPAVLRARLHGKRVAIVNDVISAGSAVRGTFEDLQSCGANTVAVASLAVLGSAAAAFATLNNLALETLRTFPFSLWTPSECPLCRAGVALQTTAPDMAAGTP